MALSFVQKKSASEHKKSIVVEQAPTPTMTILNAEPKDVILPLKPKGTLTLPKNNPAPVALPVGLALDSLVHHGLIAEEITVQNKPAVALVTLRLEIAVSHFKPSEAYEELLTWWEKHKSGSKP